MKKLVIFLSLITFNVNARPNCENYSPFNFYLATSKFTMGFSLKKSEIIEAGSWNKKSEPKMSISNAVALSNKSVEKKKLPYQIEKEYVGDPQPELRSVLDILVFQSHWGEEGDDGIDTFDFTLPGEITNYVISVRFDKAGNVEEIAMEG